MEILIFNQLLWPKVNSGINSSQSNCKPEWLRTINWKTIYQATVSVEMTPLKFPNIGKGTIMCNHSQPR